MLIKKNKIPGIACRVAASSNNGVKKGLPKSWRFLVPLLLIPMAGDHVKF